jgi:hypothetical protein
MRQPRTRPPDGLAGLLAGSACYFPWCPTAAGRIGAKAVGRLARARLTGDAEASAFLDELTLPRCQSSRREGLQLTSSSSCDETCLCRRQVLQGKTRRTRSFDTGGAPGHDIMSAESCRSMIRDRKGPRQHCSLPQARAPARSGFVRIPGSGQEKTLIGT